MKQYAILLLVFFFSFIGLSQSNAGFEKWTTKLSHEDPKVWKTANRETGRDIILATKETDAKKGNYAIKIESKSYEGDSVLGFVVLGDVGDKGPEGGIPVSTIPDSLIFWVKYKVMPGDTALAFLATRHMGSLTNMNQIGWTGESNSWERKSIKIVAALADSVVIGIAASDGLKDLAFPGSWMIIDDITLKDINGNNIPLPNSSFEEWDSLHYTNPDEWYTDNKKLGDEGNVTKSTNSYEGSFAARLETTLNDGDTLRGYLSNAPYTNGEFGKTPLIYTPGSTFDSIELYYQYFPVNKDGASIRVELHSNGSRLAEANYYIWDSAATYRRLVIPFSYSRQEGPDSIRIVFSSGKEIGSVLFLDGFSLMGKGTSIHKFKKPIALYPNPVKDLIKINSLDINIHNAFSIYTMQGVLVKKGRLNEAKQIRISDLPKGLYLLKINSQGILYSQKFLKE